MEKLIIILCVLWFAIVCVFVAYAQITGKIIENYQLSEKRLKAKIKEQNDILENPTKYFTYRVRHKEKTK